MRFCTKASVSDFGVFIKLFGCLCHFIVDERWGRYFCIVDLKMKDDENANMVQKVGGAR